MVSQQVLKTEEACRARAQDYRRYFPERRELVRSLSGPLRRLQRRLVAVEQTVNRGGGAVWPLAAIEEVARTARRHGLAVHMDGARILNAVVASGVAAQRMAAPRWK